MRFGLKKFEIQDNSELQSIEKEGLFDLQIESLHIPKKLIKLKYRWCRGTSKLNKITISEENLRYSLYQNKLVIGKSLVDQQNFDVLVFCARDVEKVTIPDFMENSLKHFYIFKHCFFILWIDINTILIYLQSIVLLF